MVSIEVHSPGDIMERHNSFKKSPYSIVFLETDFPYDIS